MKTMRGVLTLAAMTAAVALFPSSPAVAQDSGEGHAVFVMTNNADSNDVIAYERTAYGTLHDLADTRLAVAAAVARWTRSPRRAH